MTIPEDKRNIKGMVVRRMTEIKDRELYSCAYCSSVNECEYAWDPYNKEQTVERAKTENCLGMK